MKKHLRIILSMIVLGIGISGDRVLCREDSPQVVWLADLNSEIDVNEF